MSRMTTNVEMGVAEECEQPDISAVLIETRNDDSELLNECATLCNVMFWLNKGCEEREVGDLYPDRIDEVPASWAKAVVAVADAPAQTIAGFDAKLNMLKKYVEFVDCCDLTRSLVRSLCEDFYQLKGVTTKSLDKPCGKMAGIQANG